jgi:hypothetical protein
LVPEPIWSLVGSNKFCDPNAIWRNMLSNLWFSMTKISVIERVELATIF